MKTTVKKVIFTDLDGTLLDFSTYSYEKSLIGMALLREMDIPLIFCSAKTRAEQEVYRRELDIRGPFVVENGGAIFIPENYFSFSFFYNKALDNYQVIEIGIPYSEVREILKSIEGRIGYRLRSFGDMSVEEIAEDSGLSMNFARLAKQREYEETLKLEGTEEEKRLILEAIEKEGLNWTHGGRYYGVMRGCDKGKAVAILLDVFRRKFGQICSIGIGDSINDLPMLAVVDIPVLVQKPGGRWEEMDLPNLRRVEGIGPDGWTRGVRKLVLE